MSILPNSAAEIGTVKIIEKTNSYKRTYMFDFDENEFVLDVTNKVRSATVEREVLMQIVKKILQDSRYRYLAYSNDYGNEVKTLIAQDYPREILECELKRVYKEALIYHPLIQDVRDFSFEGTDDNLYCCFTVVGVNEIILQMREKVMSA